MLTMISSSRVLPVADDRQSLVVTTWVKTNVQLWASKDVQCEDLLGHCWCPTTNKVLVALTQLYPTCMKLAWGRIVLQSKPNGKHWNTLLNVILYFPQFTPSFLSPLLSSLFTRHRTPWQFVLNLAVQMFLWVTDFYSLEKIISAFPQIVLLYLKIAWRKGGGGRDGGMEEGGLCCLGS